MSGAGEMKVLLTSVAIQDGVWQRVLVTATPTTHVWCAITHSIINLVRNVYFRIIALSMRPFIYVVVNYYFQFNFSFPSLLCITVHYSPLFLYSPKFLVLSFVFVHTMTILVQWSNMSLFSTFGGCDL